MKSLRVLIIFSALAVSAGVASADCGTCEKKDQCDKPKCEQPAKSECCQKACTEADKAKCDKAKCDKEQKCCEQKPVACCDEAAKAGKTGEKCNPPEKK